MAIEFVCPACGGTLQVGDETAGRVIRCGGCMTALKVPEADTARSAPPNPYEVDRPSPPPSPRSAPSPPAEPRHRYDEDDRDDRPRRRRPPPPPPGRGVFFWLVIIGAVMLVGTIACCGGVLLMVPDTKWQKHESKDGGFRVELPNRLQPDVAKSVNISLKDTKSEGTVLLKRGAAQFIVFYRDIPGERERLAKRPAETDERVIDKEIERVLAAMQDPAQRAEKLPAGRPAGAGGFDGREIDFQGRSGFYTARVVVADTRAYVLLAGGGVTQWGDPDGRKFLDSFEIAKPELKAAGQRRADEGKKKADAAKERAGRDERRNAEAEADALNEAAEAVGGAAVGAGLREAVPATRLPVAPPPRPVED